MRSVIVKKNDAGQRVDKFIMKSFKNFPVSMMYKQIRKKNIKLNGKRCDPQCKVCEGDILSLYVNDEFLKQNEYDVLDFKKAPKKIDVVYEDSNILLVNKQAGLLVHPDEDYHFDSLISRVQHYLYDKNEYDPQKENSFAPALVNRIDRNTCGIVIIAKNSEALRMLNDKIKKREISKFYMCVVYGILKIKSATLLAFLEKDEKKKQVRVLSKRGFNSKTIKTKYKVLCEKNGKSLLEVELLTGRTHQIRAHMAYIGHPLVGDGKYGKNHKEESFGYKYQALCSYKISFDFNTDAGILNYLKGKNFSIDEIPFLNSFY